MCLKLTVLLPFCAKFTRINCNHLEMSGFSSKNIRYPRYQDTDFLQLCKTGGMISDLISFFTVEITASLTSGTKVSLISWMFRLEAEMTDSESLLKFPSSSTSLLSNFMATNSFNPN